MTLRAQYVGTRGYDLTYQMHVNGYQTVCEGGRATASAIKRFLIVAAPAGCQGSTIQRASTRQCDRLDVFLHSRCRRYLAQSIEVGQVCS